MRDLLNKITPYNLFNHLLPGVLFAVILDGLTSYSLLQENIVIGAFVYYFTGLVISRFGSLVIEPILKRSLFLKFSDHSAFVSASKLDQKIEVLSETNNMYRTFITMLTLLLLLQAYESLAIKLPFLNMYDLHILLTLLLITFLLSYRKQTTYIRKRIKLASNGNVGL